MNTIKKIVWLIVIIFITYIVLIFVKPNIANKIADIIWTRDFNQSVLDIKSKLDDASTNIPSKEDIEKAYSWAKDTISDIKWSIEDLRQKADELEDTYDKAKDFIDDTSVKLKDAKDIIDNINQ